MLLLQGNVRRLIRTCWPHFCNAYVHGDSKTSRGETASIDPRSGKLSKKAQVLEGGFAKRVNMIVLPDSTAGRSIATRFGAGKKSKHIEFRYLYVSG